jgi:hypothetical protein
MDVVDRYIVWRDNNVVHVDFERKLDPPTPTFPGVSSLRVATVLSDVSDVLAPDWLRHSTG